MLMAAPLPTAKQTVNLAAPGVKGSRIRRDPPPIVKQSEIEDPRERDVRVVVTGLIVFTLAIAVVVLAIGRAAGWSAAQEQVNLVL